MESELIIENEKELAIKEENKVTNKGVLILLVAAVVDWELFQWLYTILQVKH